MIFFDLDCGAVQKEKAMITENLSVTDTEILLHRLTGNVFHLTPRASYEQICKTGEILNNKSGCFPINTSSQNSYGRLQGCVCLFDLRNATPEIIQNTLDCYYFLGPSWFCKQGRKYDSWDLVYLFLDPQYYDRLIFGSRVHDHYRETGKFLQFIPKAEAWIENKIPLEWINKALIVKIKKPLPDKTTPAGWHSLGVRKVWDKRKS